MALGRAMGATALGPLAPVGSALRGAVSPWAALATACAVAVGLGHAWLILVSRRAERRPRATRRRHLDAAWRFPIAASVSSLVTRRTDVRRASLAALGFGLTGALVAVVAGSASPGPFLLATTTTLLGSLVAALALFGILLRVPGSGSPHRGVSALWRSGRGSSVSWRPRSRSALSAFAPQLPRALTLPPRGPSRFSS